MNPNIKEEIRLSAQKLLHFNNLLIRQCDSWLPEEDGNRNMLSKIVARDDNYQSDNTLKAEELSRKMMKEYMERKKEERKTRILNGVSKVKDFFGFRVKT